MSHFAISYYTQAGTQENIQFQIIPVSNSVCMEKWKKHLKKTVNVLKLYMKKKTNKQKTQYLTLIQTNRIAHMGMNVTIWM